MTKITVNLAPGAAEDVLRQALADSGMSVQLVGSCRNRARDGKEVILLVYDKYYHRNSSRASLTLLIESLSDATQVVAIGSGGSQFIFSTVDFGAADGFERVAQDALSQYAIGL